MEGILLVGKFTEKFRAINKSLVGKYEVRACIRQLNIIEGMVKRKVPALIAMVLDEEETEDEVITNQLKESYSNVPVIWLECSLPQETILEKIETVINGEKKEAEVEEAEVAEEVEKERRVEVPIKKWTKTNKKVVLMVDDSGIFLRSMKSMIDDHYDVRVSTSGLNIQGLIQEHKPDVVLLDYEMPMFDGKQTLLKMRECEEMKDIPVIFVTAVNKKENIINVLNLKPAGYILKPVEKDRILQKIREIIGE